MATVKLRSQLSAVTVAMPAYYVSGILNNIL